MPETCLVTRAVVETLDATEDDRAHLTSREPLE